MRLLIADLAKLRRRLATWLTLGLLAGLLALVFIAVGGTANRAAAQPGARAAVAILSFPAAYDVILTFILGLGGLMAVIYGAAIAGSEWTWGTLKSAIARGESRARYVLAMFAAVAIVFAVATLARSQLAGIGVGIGLYFGESFASLFLPDFVKYLPFNVASAAVRTAETTAGGGGFGGNAVVSLPPDTALLAVVGWLIGAVLVASLFTERAEITG